MNPDGMQFTLLPLSESCDFPFRNGGTPVYLVLPKQSQTLLDMKAITDSTGSSISKIPLQRVSFLSEIDPVYSLKQK